MKVRYYVTRRDGKWGYWAPCLKRMNIKTGKIEPTLMAKLGFNIIGCGRDGPQAWAIAESWNAKWDAALTAYRSGMPIDDAAAVQRVFPSGSLGEAFARFRKTNAWIKDKKPRTKEDWWRGWKHIEPVFGDVDPRTIAMENVDLWYGGDPENPEIKGLLGTLGVREAHRVMKIWRALWRVAGTLNRDDGERYCDGKNDPSLGFNVHSPKPRNVFWYEGEAVRLVKKAIRMRFIGLAAALAVAWDTSLSPVDVRTLTKAQLTGDAEGPFFTADRTKTGRSAIGTLSRRTQRLLRAYMETLPEGLIPSSPIFMTRGGQPVSRAGVLGERGGDRGGGRPRKPVPYTADTLGDDFREVRNALLPGDTRQMMDFRRSGSVEATAGEVAPTALAAKMANTIDTNKNLQATYQPHTASLVRLADEARVRGRKLMRDANVKGSKS